MTAIESCTFGVRKTEEVAPTTITAKVNRNDNFLTDDLSLRAIVEHKKRQQKEKKRKKEALT